MTMPAPRPSSTAADLMRLLAVWLAAILLVQGLAAGLALGAGPLHRHGSAAVPNGTTTAPTMPASWRRPSLHSTRRRSRSSRHSR
jgi:hypothetical protein